MGQRPEYDAFRRPVSERPRHDRDAQPGAHQTENGQDVPRFVRDGRCEPGLGARPEDQIVEGGSGVERDADEGFRTEIGKPETGGARHRVIGRERRNQGRLGNGLDGYAPVRHGKNWKGNVNPSVGEGFDLLTGVKGLEVEDDARVAREEGVEDLRLNAGFGSRAERDREPPDLSVPCLAGGGHGVVGVLENAAHLLEEDAAGFRERDEVSRPVKEAHAELALEVLDLMGQRGLRDMELLRGSPEVKLVGDRNEVAQVPQFHRCTPRPEVSP